MLNYFYVQQRYVKHGDTGTQELAEWFTARTRSPGGSALSPLRSRQGNAFSDLPFPATRTPACRSFSHHQLGSSRRAVRFSSVQRMIFRHASEPSPEVGLKRPNWDAWGGWTCGNRRLLLPDDQLFQLLTTHPWGRNLHIHT